MLDSHRGRKTNETVTLVHRKREITDCGRYENIRAMFCEMGFSAFKTKRY